MYHTLIRSKYLLNTQKHFEVLNLVWLSEKKNQIQKSNWKKDSWLHSHSTDILSIMWMKFSITAILLGIVNSERRSMTLYAFSTEASKECCLLDGTLRYICEAADFFKHGRCLHIFQRENATVSHKAKATQE